MYKTIIILAVTLFSTYLCSTIAEESVLQSMEREFQAIVKSVQPSVVEVVATCTATTQKISGDQRTLITDDSETLVYYQNIGSGIIIDSAGHIVTTAGVVENCRWN